ncbi:RTA1 like protein-domain-containing protein [Flagelloscypha sp. PMI_526]|nr:RTA1 like protein-domain-containing protein [Flagelloscypha sp. PMI_526]
MASVNGTLTPRGNENINLDDTPYGYIPTGWICFLFLSLFGVSGIVHLIQAFWYKAYWLLPTATLCAAGEALGWSARLWSHYNVMLDTPFMIQISTTIISPTFLLAINFIVFGRVVHLLGQQYSILSARWISIIFISADIFALAMQGTGGGLASGDVSPGQLHTGSSIILAGIAFQFGIMVIAALLAFHFAWSWRTCCPVRKNTTASPSSPGENQNSSSIQLSNMSQSQSMNEKRWLASGNMLPFEGREAFNFRCLLWAICLNSFFLFVRAIYRLIELTDGWDGAILRTEKWFSTYSFFLVHGCDI